jgi:hypothetical protein
MKMRIVRVEDGYWRIRSERREIRAKEQSELIDYFNEIRFPYRVIAGRLCVPESVPWSDIYERLQHFYDGRAQVFPF